MKPIAIPLAQLRDALEYRDGALFWKAQRPTIAGGRRAGTKTAKGYRQVCLNGRLYLEHRLVWCWHSNQDLPASVEIDHINRIRDDNRIENLRLASSSLNKANSSRRRSASGYIGVVRNGPGWQARCGGSKSGGQHGVIGQFRTAEEAAKAYDCAAMELYGPFARQNHARNEQGTGEQP